MGARLCFVSFWLFLPSLKAAMGEVLEGCWKAPQPGRKTFLWDRVNIVSGCPSQLVPKLRNLPGMARHPGDPQEECGMRGLGGEPSFQLGPALLLLLLPLQPLSPLYLSLSILLLSCLPRDSSPRHPPICVSGKLSHCFSVSSFSFLSFLSLTTASPVTFSPTFSGPVSLELLPDPLDHCPCVLPHPPL